LAGVFVISFATLLLELSLTRLFSVALFYHFAFLAISVALLGLGTGGLAAFLLRQRLARFRLAQRLSVVCWAAAGADCLALYVVLHSAISLDISAANFLRLTAIYASAALPFIGVGFCVSSVMAELAEQVHRLYCADLAGAGAACLALVPVMNSVGGPSAALVCSAGFIVAALMFQASDCRGIGVEPSGSDSTASSSRRNKTRLFSIQAAAMVAIAALLLLTVFNRHGRLFDVNYAKGQRRANVEFKKWNSLSRIEVIGRNSKDIVIDADADSALVGTSLDEARQSPTAAAPFMRYSPALPYVLRPGGKVLVIGPGGGSDVMRALLGGSTDVTAVEINPIIVRDVMQGRYRDWTHDLYGRPEVHAVVAEGRSFVRSSNVSYDVIQATLVDTWASTAAGALALSESNLYTVEAFQEYLRHLTPDGVLAMTRFEFAQPREALRVVSVAMEALRRELGVTHAASYFVLVSDGPLTNFGVTVTTVVRRSPFTPADIDRLARYISAHPPLRFQYRPDLNEQNAYSALLHSGNGYEFARNYRFNVAPVTDNRPFFFYTLKTWPAIKSALFPKASDTRSMDWKNNLAAFLLLSLLLISAAAVVFFMLLPLAIGVGVERGRARPLTLLYFVALGLGYILIEIAFIQRFVLFLGHPTYALTVVLLVLMLSSGAGSFWIGGSHASRGLLITTIVVVGLVYAALIGIALDRWLGLPLPAKFVIAVALIAPLGFLMGAPFPSGIRALSLAGDEVVEWAWALNAAATVLGSVLAMFVVIHLGIRGALVAGAAAYFAAAIAERHTGW
jgi:SAM-dependent methyltransferase